MAVHTITSLSGGKSSAYMWLNNPTDYCIFALVLTDDPATAPKDPGVLREVKRRIPGFVGTAELEQTLVNVLRLEQETGKPIRWVCAYEGQGESRLMRDKSGWLPSPLTFDALINSKKVLPDKSKRFCTEQLKVVAIFWHIYLHIFESPDDVALMNVGYRYGEERRWIKLQTCDQNKMRYPVSCSLASRKQSWKEKEYRVPRCPMIEHKVDTIDVMAFWAKKGWVWPLVSNCAHCFFHDQYEIQHIHDRTPAVIDWAIAIEERLGSTFDSQSSLKEKISAHQELIFDSSKFACFCSD